MIIDQNYSGLEELLGEESYSDRTGRMNGKKRYRLFGDIIADEDIEIRLNGDLQVYGKIESKGNIKSDSFLNVSKISAKGDIIIETPELDKITKLQTPLGGNIEAQGKVDVDGTISCGGNLLGQDMVRSTGTIYSYGNVNTNGEIFVGNKLVSDGDITCHHLKYGDYVAIRGKYSGEFCEKYDRVKGSSKGYINEQSSYEKLTPIFSADSNFERIKFGYQQRNQNWETNKVDFTTKLIENDKHQEKVEKEVCGIHTEFIGRLATDPELKKVPKNGEEISVCDVDIAVNRLHSDKVDFITMTVWGKQAEQLVEGNQKGSKIGVEGELQTELYEKSDGTKRKNYKVVANTIKFLDRKKKKDEQQEITQEQELER